jgi:hypothetical protein
MSQSNPNDKADTSDQIKNPRPINGEKTWLRHKADAESGMIDLMILSGNFKLIFNTSKKIVQCFQANKSAQKCLGTTFCSLTI